MAIISTVQKKKRRRNSACFLGAYVPKELADFITLYCNALEETKMSIITDLLTKWMSDKKNEGFSNELLEKKIAERSFSAWEEKEGMSFATFISMLKYEFKQKKLDITVVDRILLMVENLKNEKNEK